MRSTHKLRETNTLRDTQYLCTVVGMTDSLDTTPRRRRRDQQRDETRRDLALTAFRIATSRGLANVRVPEIAAAAGVSPRTFNNYFHSKEEAIVWPAAQHAASMASLLRDRPAGEPLGDALVAAVVALYGPEAGQELPADWLGDFRDLVAAEPSLHGEYLRAASTAERALADAVAERMGAPAGQLRARVVAGMVVGAERAAVMHWMQTRDGSLADTVRTAVLQATASLGDA
ncbi:Transcriptional regulator [Amycolatopsis camponoti]|uniref:Transcriptional regulator n=2 Tax=Amycolatopsis camponoti TaxID=2606593 RepID=A0A6I8LPS6_9PSEU|nr:Transcriptional regulator [Amycolatopsis camponoti]